MVYSVAFSPNKDTITFATGAHQAVQVWDLTGQSILGPLPADQEFVSCVAFSADGKHLASVGHSRIARVWDIVRGREICSFERHNTSVYSVAFHPSGKYLASGDTNFNVRLWSPATGKEIPGSPLCKHSDVLQRIAFSRDGKYLATASAREIIVWDTERFKPLRTFDRLAGRIWSVAFSPDGKRLAAATGYKGKGEIKIWDLGEGR
jgi:WD40 repeat protein